jgi:hypothetical protein
MLAVCDNVPELPTKLTRTAVGVAGASLAAVSVIAVGLYGVTVIFDGDTVTPVGKPLTTTVIVPLKPFKAVLFSVTCALAPGVSIIVAGVAVSVKSPLVGGGGGGGGVVTAVTVSATDVFVLSVPDAPYTFTVVVPTAALAAAVSLKVVLAPIMTVAVAGDTVTPVGRALNET